MAVTVSKYAILSSILVVIRQQMNCSRDHLDFTSVHQYHIRNYSVNNMQQIATQKDRFQNVTLGSY